MYFLVLRKRKAPLSDNILNNIPKMLKYNENLEKRKKIRFWAFFAGSAGDVTIYDVKTNEELGELVWGNPLSLLSDHTVFPLESPKAAEKILSKAKNSEKL